MPSMLAAWDLGAATVAVALAALHLGLATRIDLGPATMGAAAVALVASGAPSTDARALLAVATVLTALAWWRGARRGTGRPELTGAVLAVGAAADAAVALLPRQWPSLADVTVRQAAVGPIVLVACVAVVVAYGRRGMPGQRVHHHREIPVRGRPRSVS